MCFGDVAFWGGGMQQINVARPKLFLFYLFFGVAVFLCVMTVIYEIGSLRLGRLREEGLKYEMASQFHLGKKSHVDEIKYEANFVNSLGAIQSTSTVVEALLKAGYSRQVSFKTISIGTKEPRGTTLSVENMKIVLVGTYVNMKLVLSDVMQQFPGLLVQQIVMRKMTSPTDVQAQVDLLLVSQPVESPAPLQ